MSFIDAIQMGVAKFADTFTGKPLPSYCNLDTAIPLTEDDLRRNPELTDPYIVTTERCDLITIFDLQGVFQIMGPEKYGNMVDDLADRMTPYMSKQAHTIWISYEQDPERAFDEMALIASPQIRASHKMGIDVSDIIVDRVKKNAAFCHFEQNLLIVMTSLNAVPKNVRSDELAEKFKEIKKGKRQVFSQDLKSVFESVKNIHETLVHRITEDFRLCDPSGSGILVRRISAPEGVKRLRIMINREATAQNYRPQLISDRVTPRGDAEDLDDIHPPKLKWQICTNELEVEKNSSFINTGALLHGNLQMELGPLKEMPFSDLLSRIDRTQPFRATFCLRPRGLDAYKLRYAVSSLLGFAGSAKQTNRTLKWLHELDKTTPVLGFQAAFSTWGPDQKTLKRRLSALESALAGWGMCGIGGAKGDPIAHWTATIPAFGSLNPAPVMTPPINNVLQMMPFDRPASAFVGTGWVNLRTPDGKIMPGHLYPSIQDTWIELYAGTPGSGKSLLLNVFNFHFLVAPGYTELPLYLNLDVGSSSAGLIKVIQDNLPPSRKHEAIAFKLENTSKYAINVFDTQLGLRRPLPTEERFQVDFLTRLCANPVTLEVPSAISGLMAKLIKLAYTHVNTGSGRPLYEFGTNQEVDACIDKFNLKLLRPESWWAYANWFEIVDLLFENGHVQEALIAQRFAVPKLATIGQMCALSEIKSEYDDMKVLETNEPVLKYVTRCLGDAAAKYPMISGFTQFELSSETRVIAIDLAPVVGGSDTGLFYMLGRYIGAKNFFLDEETFMPRCPDLYKQHHLKRIKGIRSEKRSIVADETHNFSGDELTTNMFIKDAREGRKLGLRVALSSQYLSDNSDALLAAATSVYVLRGGHEGDAHILRTKFQISEESIRKMNRECRGPTAAGANFLALFKTKLGTIVQILTNSCSATELWAFNTNQLDMVIRDELSKEFGSVNARRHLVKTFPAGTAIPQLEKMRIEAGNKASDDTEENMAVAQKMVQKLSNEIRREQYA